MCTKNEQLSARRERDLNTKKRKYHNDPEMKRYAITNKNNQ